MTLTGSLKSWHVTVEVLHFKQQRVLQVVRTEDDTGPVSVSSLTGFGKNSLAGAAWKAPGDFTYLVTATAHASQQGCF